MSRTEVDDSRLQAAYWTLRLSFALMGVVIGADKFFHLLAEWEGYLAPVIARNLPGGPGPYFFVVAIIEIVVGVALLTRWVRPAAWVMGFWLLGITANLILAGIYDTALRDFLLAMAALSLALMTPAARAGSPDPRQ